MSNLISNSCLRTRQPLWVILHHLHEKGRKGTEELEEERDERNKGWRKQWMMQKQNTNTSPASTCCKNKRHLPPPHHPKTSFVFYTMCMCGFEHFLTPLTRLAKTINLRVWSQNCWPSCWAAGPDSTLNVTHSIKWKQSGPSCSKHR